MGADFREASAEDARALAAVHAAYPHLPAWSAAAYRQEIGTFETVCVTAGPREKPSGFAVIRLAAGEAAAELRMIAVSPGEARKGLGRALLAEAERRAAAKGVLVMRLEVSAGNAAAMGLYASAGYRVVGRRAKYYNDGSDALLMDKELK